jgi:hypothetical protein
VKADSERQTRCTRYPTVVRGFSAGLLLLVGCTGASGDTDGPIAGDQLRALGVNVAGRNVLHGSGPSLEDGTHLGPTPLTTDGYLTGGVVPLRIVGTVQDWTAELIGDPAFGFVIDDFFGDIVGVTCTPAGPGGVFAELVVTAASQPGREFRVGFACTGDLRAAVMPGEVQALGADGRIAMASGSGVEVIDGSATVTLDAAGVVPPTGLATDGGVVLLDLDGSLRAALPGSSSTEVLPMSGAIAGLPWVSEDGQVVTYSNGDDVVRIDREAGTATPVGPDRAFTTLSWTSPDGRYALASTGNPFDLSRELTLIDTEAAAPVPFEDASGVPWAETAGFEVAALTADLSSFFEVRSYFYDVGIDLTNTATGSIEPFLDAARSDAAARFSETHHLAEVEFTRDLRHVAVVFDNITADPGGFRLDGSGVYVIDLQTGATWLASVDLKGEAMEFARGGFDGRLIGTVRIAPDGGSVVFGGVYRTERAAWVSVP